MTFDYGFRSKAGFRGPAKLALAAGVAIAGAIPIGVYWASHRQESASETADAKAYGASGPPCPMITPQVLAQQGPHLRQSFEFGDMTLTYAFGDVDCAWIRDASGRYPICRFFSPGALEVKAGKTDLVFAPGVGRSAAVLRRKGEVSCLMPARVAK